MDARRLIAALMITLGLSGPAMAATVNTKLAESGVWETGIETDFVLDRDLRVQSAFGSGGVSAESFRYLPTFAYGLADWLTVTGKVGAASVDQEWTDFGHSPALSIGLTAKLAVWMGWDVLTNLSYLTLIDPDTEIEGVSYDASWNEPQAALIFSRILTLFGKDVRFYFGGKVSDVDADIDAKVSSIVYEVDVDAENKGGGFVGVGIPIGKYVEAEVQGRFLDERAITGKISYKF